MKRRPSRFTLFPYTTLFRSLEAIVVEERRERDPVAARDLRRRLARPHPVTPGALRRVGYAAVAALGWHRPGRGGPDPPTHGADDPLPHPQRVRADVRVRTLDHG